MVTNVMENNITIIAGNVLDEPKLSHEVYGEGFYTVNTRVRRLSDTYDVIPVMFSERLIPVEEFAVTRFIRVEGQFRSYNNYNVNGNKLMLTVFARDIQLLTDEQKDVKNPNQIFLNGFLCKDAIYRTTPFGREITDLLLAVNRSYNKSDYIPCICWGRNARYASHFSIGDNIKIWGRVQSRKYNKKLADGNVLEKIAFEISVSKMEKVNPNTHEQNTKLQEEQVKE